jgi:NADPH2:quinone reductase
MKAIVVKEFGDPSVLQLVEVPDPKPGSGQVVVRLHATGVNPVDTYVRAGAYAKKPALPYTPGADGAGVVLSVGKEVTRFKPGDRVYVAGTLTGTCAEQALCEERTVFPLPEHVSCAQGAAVHIPYATAFRALFDRAHAQAGETVLIHGASGGVGIAAVQLARAAGLRVVGTAGSDRGLKLILEEGAHVAISHKGANYFDELLAATRGRGYEVILEMLANVNLGRDLPLLAVHGRVVVVGSRGSVEITPRDAMTRDASILAMSLINLTPQDLTRIHSALVAGLENKTLRPVIGQEIPLAEAARAHVAVLEPGAHGKIVLIP